MIRSRIEKSNHQTRIRINAGEVRAFEQIAPLAGPGQIFESVRPTMLFCDDVIEMGWPERQIAFMEAAIFTAPPGARPNGLPKARCDQAARRRAKNLRALA
jgi:hypothetical protein